MLTKDHSLLIGPNQLRNILSRRAERLRGVADKPTASNTPVVSADVRCMSGGPAVLLLIVRKLINCISSRRHEGLMTTTDSTSWKCGKHRVCNHQQLQGSCCHPTAFLMFFLFSEGAEDLIVQQRRVPQLPSYSSPLEIEMNGESLSSPAWERAKLVLTESQHQQGWKRPLGSPSPTSTPTKLVPTLSHVP